MTDEPTPAEPTPSADPPPLAPLVQQAAAPAPAAYAPPPIAPPAAQPVAPPVAWGAPPAAAAVQGKRTGLALIAGIVMVILGILGGLAGLLVAVVGGTFFGSLGDFADIPELNGANAGNIVGGFVAFFGIIILIYSLVYLIGGIGVIRSRGWGRVLGLIVGILSGLVWLSGVSNAGSISSAGGGSSSMVSGIVGLAIHAYIVVVLLFFWRSKPSSG